MDADLIFLTLLATEVAEGTVHLMRESSGQESDARFCFLDVCWLRRAIVDDMGHRTPL